MSRIFLCAASVVRLCAAANNTINNDNLHTWWHKTGEINTKTPVQPGNVRQSHLYSVQVTNAIDQVYYDSFVYETIPRNGQGNIIIPGDPSSVSSTGDGITIEEEIGLTMAWSSFLYTADVWLKVSRGAGRPISASDVTIRPTNLDYTTSAAGGDFFILVPYSSNGAKFSIEFADDVYVFHDKCNQPDCSYGQNTTVGGYSYVTEFTDTMPVMSREPLNSLLIFASPFEDASLIPDQGASNTVVVQEGRVSGLDTTSATTVIFNPGVYYMTATDHLLLSASVSWIYFAPGAYVKGAVEYKTSAPLVRATGHGVLSGEQYVYQADPTYFYQNHNVDASPLRMWKGEASSEHHTTWIVDGVTINSPPFNSMDWNGSNTDLSVYANDFKQVGAFFGQTDGMQMYPGSRFTNIFYHSNDDTIKVYYSNTTATNILVYKASTAPVLQFGWANRNISSVIVSDVNIIHSRWNSNLSNPGLIGSNNLYDPSFTGTSNTNLDTSDSKSVVQDVSLLNWRSEGISGPLMRIYALGNIRGFTISGFWIEEFGQGNGYEDVGVEESFMPMMTDREGNEVSVADFVVEDFVVGCEVVEVGNAREVGGLVWDARFGVDVR